MESLEPAAPMMGVVSQSQQIPMPIHTLATKVGAIFSLYVQGNIPNTQQIAENIQEPYPGWKEQLLYASKNDLVSYASLLERALDSCIQEARTLKDNPEYSEHHEFLQAIADIEITEKEYLTTELGNEYSPERSAIQALIAATPSVAFSLTRTIRYLRIPHAMEHFMETVLIGATRIPGIAYIPEGIVMAKEALVDKNYTPAKAAFITGIATTTVLGIGGSILLFTPAAPIGAAMQAAAVPAGAFVGARAADTTRIAQAYHKRNVKKDIEKNPEIQSIRERLTPIFADKKKHKVTRGEDQVTKSHPGKQRFTKTLRSLRRYSEARKIEVIAKSLHIDPATLQATVASLPAAQAAAPMEVSPPPQAAAPSQAVASMDVSAPKDLQAIGAKIKSARGTESQKSLADRTKISQKKISRIERGLEEMSPEEAQNLATALQIDVNDLTS